MLLSGRMYGLRLTPQFPQFPDVLDVGAGLDTVLRAPTSHAVEGVGARGWVQGGCYGGPNRHAESAYALWGAIRLDEGRGVRMCNSVELVHAPITHTGQQWDARIGLRSMVYVAAGEQVIWDDWTWMRRNFPLSVTSAPVIVWPGGGYAPSPAGCPARAR